MPRKNNRHGSRAMPLQRIAERVGVPVKKIICHLPEPDEPEPVETSDIRTKKRVWDDIRPGKVRAIYTPRGGVAR